MSNFCGRKYNLDLIESLRNVSGKWRLLLDAAAFVATNPLDLSVLKPDFVCVSFYKLMGYPTGLGALIARKSALEELRANKVYFGGGTVEMHLVEGAGCVLRSGAGLEESLEDGTSHFQGILCLKRGLQLMQRIPRAVVAAHTFALARYLFHRFVKM
jgi:molybdenum cofactor sulfurtransferase